MKVKSRKKEKAVGRNSGKSKSIEYHDGVRRRDFITGELLAPRSIRKTKKKRTLLKDCSKTALEKAGVKGVEEW